MERPRLLRRGQSSHTYEQLDEGIYESYIQGSASKPYHTVIDINHPKKSHCDCPFAEGRRVICKHMVALEFTLFPKEVEALMLAVEESEKAEAEWKRERYEEKVRYVKSLKKEELQQKLLNAMRALEERNNRYW